MGMRADIAAWQRACEMERRLIPQIASYALSTWGWNLFREAFRRFSIGHHSPESLQKLLYVLDPWFAFTWVPNWEDECQTCRRTGRRRHSA